MRVASTTLRWVSTSTFSMERSRQRWDLCECHEEDLAGGTLGRSVGTPRRRFTLGSIAPEGISDDNQADLAGRRPRRATLQSCSPEESLSKGSVVSCMLVLTRLA